MPTCLPPSAGIWNTRRGPARATARSGRGCGCSTAFGSAAAACSGSCAKTACCLRIAAHPRPATEHDGSITTAAPNVMWGADGAVISTVEDGNVTVFIVAEHWNGEGLGWHVAKSGNRYAAAEALALAVGHVFGSTGADAAQGLSLRHDHGSAFMSGYFQKQLKAYGMAPSFAFVREPETNGVAERFI